MKIELWNGNIIEIPEINELRSELKSFTQHEEEALNEDIKEKIDNFTGCDSDPHMTLNIAVEGRKIKLKVTGWTILNCGGKQGRTSVWERTSDIYIETFDEILKKAGYSTNKFNMLSEASAVFHRRNESDVINEWYEYLPDKEKKALSEWIAYTYLAEHPYYIDDVEQKTFDWLMEDIKTASQSLWYASGIQKY